MTHSDEMSPAEVFAITATRHMLAGNVSQRLGLVECTNEEYHSGPGISKSHLDVIAKSPLKYWQTYINPDREPRAPTPALVLGTAIHAAILEPDTFEQRFAFIPESIDRRTKIGKEDYAAWLEDVKGRTVLTREQYSIALDASDSVAANARASDLLSLGKAEQSFYAIEPDTGALVKCRTDWLNGVQSTIVDVKSTEDASPEGFMRSVLKYDYHVQVAWYLDVIAAALDAEAPLDWIFLAVEKEPPYAVGLYRLPPAVVKAGRELARQRLRKIIECRQADRWPDYNEGCIVELQPPRWMEKQLELNTPEVDFA